MLQSLFLVLCDEELAQSCHLIVVLVLHVRHVFHVAEKVDNTVFCTECAVFGCLFDLKAATSTPLEVLLQVLLGLKVANEAFTHVLNAVC